MEILRMVKLCLVRIFVFFLLAGTLSCSTMAKKYYGIKSPRLEDKASVNKFLNSKKIDTTRVLYFRSLRDFAVASQNKYLAIPNAYFFNADGNWVPYMKSAKDCNASVDDFILDLHRFDKEAANEQISLPMMTSLLTGADKIKSSEITVLMTFTKFAGRLNREKAFEWVRLLEAAKSRGLPVNYYLVNCDYQKSWNIPPEIIKKYGIRK
jgi:hypothetical protein